MKKSTIVTSVVIVGLLGFAIFLMNAGGPSSDSDTEATVPNVSSNDWSRGNPDAQVSVIEYGDFQCPACGSYHPIIKQLEEEFSDRVVFSFRHFPLRQIHPNAEPAARAAEAAGKQGKFWEMHDILFERQNEWSNQLGAIGKINEYAQELGLDMEQFNADLVSDEIKDLVNADHSEATGAGLNSTPSFFINAKKIPNPQSIEEFRQMLTDALQTNQ